jgi:hypothetical protein
VPELYRNCTASCDLIHLCNLLCHLYGSCRVSGFVPELYRNCTFVTQMYPSLYPLCTRLCILFVPFYLEFARIPDTILDTRQGHDTGNTRDTRDISRPLYEQKRTFWREKKPFTRLLSSLVSSTSNGDYWPPWSNKNFLAELSENVTSPPRTKTMCSIRSRRGRRLECSLPSTPATNFFAPHMEIESSSRKKKLSSCGGKQMMRLSSGSAPGMLPKHINPLEVPVRTLSVSNEPLNHGQLNSVPARLAA